MRKIWSPPRLTQCYGKVCRKVFPPSPWSFFGGLPCSADFILWASTGLHSFRSVMRTHCTSSALHWIQVASFPDFFLWKVCISQFLPSFAVGINFPWWTSVSKSTTFDNYYLGIAETHQRKIIQEILFSGFSNQFLLIYSFAVDKAMLISI